MNRRRFILTGAAAVPLLYIRSSSARVEAAAVGTSEQQQGDFELPVEEVKISASAARQVNMLRTLRTRPPTVAVKPSKDFALHMLKIAEEQAKREISRASNPQQVSRYLNVFNLDPDGDMRDGSGGHGDFIAFCACGVSYVACCSDAGLTDNDPISRFAAASKEVTENYFRCDPWVASIRTDAEQRKTWRDRSVSPKPCWLVLFHFKRNHIGIVKAATGRTLTTVEFNTGGPRADQRNGGCVLEKTREINGNVQGFVALYEA